MKSRLTPLPPPHPHMAEVRDFDDALPRAGKTFAKIKIMKKATTGDHALKWCQIYDILKKAKVEKA